MIERDLVRVIDHHAFPPERFPDEAGELLRAAGAFAVVAESLLETDALLIRHHATGVGIRTAPVRSGAAGSTVLLVGDHRRMLDLATALIGRDDPHPEFGHALRRTITNALQRSYRLRLPDGGELSLGERTLIMGIVNVTPDSFSDGGDHLDPDVAVEAALCMVEEGADLLDVGGESTRPGAAPTGDEEESARILPVIERLAAEA